MSCSTSRRQFLNQCAAAALATPLGGAVTATPVAAAETAVPAAPPALRVSRGYAPGPHGLVHFHDSRPQVMPPAGDLPLLLLHQSPASARQFERAFGPLVRRNVRFVAVDTPGFGFSDPPPSLPRIEDLASSIVAVMDHLGIAQADVLGHHTGSLLATELALQYPKRVRRVVLNGPFPIDEAERQKFVAGSQRSHERGAPKLDGSHLLSSFQARVRMYGPDPDPQTITRIVVEKYQGLAPFTWGHDAAFRYDHAASLKRITQPALILTNTGDDIYPMAQRARTLRPDFAYHELQGGTHDIVDQQPEAWAEAVVAYLRRPLP